MFRIKIGLFYQKGYRIGLANFAVSQPACSSCSSCSSSIGSSIGASLDSCLEKCILCFLNIVVGIVYEYLLRREEVGGAHSLLFHLILSLLLVIQSPKLAGLFARLFSFGTWSGLLFLWCRKKTVWQIVLRFFRKMCDTASKGSMCAFALPKFMRFGTSCLCALWSSLPF